MLPVLVTALAALGAASASAANVLQADRDAVLHEMDAGRIAHRRSMCASGQMPSSIAMVRAAGFQSLSAAASCVAVLTRAGRDGTLGYVRMSDGQLTPAIAFDNGFVGAWLGHEAVPPTAPTMATLLPIAGRCLDQKETDTALCRAAGYMLGLRAAHGELVPAS